MREGKLKNIQYSGKDFLAAKQTIHSLFQSSHQSVGKVKKKLKSILSDKSFYSVKESQDYQIKLQYMKLYQDQAGHKERYLI